MNLNNELINPIAQGRLLLDIASDISISDNFETASDLEICARNLYINGKLKAKNLKFKLENFALTGYVETQGNIDVSCNNFTNNSGICEALGNAIFNVTNKFINTGGKRTEQHTIEFPCYTCNTANSGPNNSEVRSGCKTLFGSLGRASDARLINHIGKISINIYSLNPNTVANISAADVLVINADKIQNDFDILYGRNGISIDGQREITNIGGVIYTQNETKIRTVSLYNGISEINDVFIPKAVDPSQPIKKSYVRLREIEVLKHQRFEEYHESYVSGYRRLPDNGKIHIQDTNAPGYIFSEGDVFIDAKMNTELGTVVSAKNIYIEGRSQRTTAKLITHGNIAMSMVNINLATLKAKAETIAIQQRNNLILAGIIEPVAITDKNRSVMINLTKLSKSFGFALYDTPVLKSDTTSLLTVSPSVRYGDNFVTVREPRKVGFKCHEYNANSFIPTLADTIVAKLIRLIVTPIYGTLYYNIDLVGILEHNGLEYQSFVLSNINDMPRNALALVYGNEEEGEALRDDTIVKIPQRSPYLVIGNIDEETNYLKAKLEVILKSQENIELHPQAFKIDTQNLGLASW